MPLDFPTSPTDGQTYNGYVYSTSVGAWQAKPSAQSPFYTSDTPPANPTKGDSWFNTNDGTMYIYTYDGNTYQWVEHRSEIARSQVGLVPIKPTSVTVGSGTASVSVDGTVTFTSCNYFDISGVFSSAYANYKIIFESVSATVADTRLAYVLTNSSGTNGSIMTYQRIYSQNASIGADYGNSLAYGILGIITGYDCAVDATLYRPNKAQNTLSQSQCIYYRNEASILKPFIEQYHSGCADTSQYTGIRLYDPSASITGKLKVYGYN